MCVIWSFCDQTCCLEDCPQTTPTTMTMTQDDNNAGCHMTDNSWLHRLISKWTKYYHIHKTMVLISPYCSNRNRKRPVMFKWLNYWWNISEFSSPPKKNSARWLTIGKSQGRKLVFIQQTFSQMAIYFFSFTRCRAIKKAKDEKTLLNHKPKHFLV